jgi:hypothetical protein
VKIVEAKALPAFRLKLKFDNGESGIVDLSSLVGRGVFAAGGFHGNFGGYRSNSAISGR